MKWKLISVLLVCSVFVAGCSGTTKLDPGLQLRARLLSATGYSFSTQVNADFGENVYSFEMDCQVDSQGAVAFCVTAPESISGITGNLNGQGGELTFDGTALAFDLLADGRFSPVSAPWLLVHTLHEGFITSCADLLTGVMLTIDESFRDDALTLHIYLGADTLPSGAEVFCDGQRVLSMTVNNFVFL